jgi:hypothetical protein
MFDILLYLQAMNGEIKINEIKSWFRLLKLLFCYKVMSQKLTKSLFTLLTNGKNKPLQTHN